MTSRGVFAVKRSIFDDPEFEPEPFTQREAWLWLIKEAAWKKRARRISGQIIELERSQLTASIRFMAQAWQWSKSKVARFIERMAARGMIFKEAGKGCQQLVITICDYDAFQRVSLPRDGSGTVAGQSGNGATVCNGNKKENADQPENRQAGQQRDKQESIKKNNKSPLYPPTGETEPEQKAAPDDDEEEVIDLGFEKFWRAFPPGRKQDKLKTRRKYRQIVSGRDPELKASVAEIQAAVECYAAKRASQPERFTKMPCTWLSKGCWLEDNAGAPPVFRKEEKAKPKSPDDIWFDNLTKRILGEQKAKLAPAGGV